MLKCFRGPEISEFVYAFPADEYVLRLDIPVDDLMLFAYGQQTVGI